MAKKTYHENLITNPDTLFKYSVDIIVVTVGLLITGFYLNGFNAIRTAFWSVLVCVLCEDIGCRIMKRHDRSAQDIYAAATGLSIALMLPATIRSYIVIAAAAFAVLVVLIPFGSARKLPFVPAAAGVCFVTVCFKKAVFTYAPIKILTSSPLYGSQDFVAGESLSKMLTYGRSLILNPISTITVLVGRAPGPMGTTCVLVLIGAAMYLLFKRKEGFVVTISFLLSCAAYAALFPRVNSGAVTSVVLELSSGTLLFTGIVLLPNPYTAPSKTVGKIFYGLTAGVICMVLRRYGVFEESACFTVLLMNAIAPAVGDHIDLILDPLRKKGILKEKVKKFTDLSAVIADEKAKKRKDDAQVNENAEAEETHTDKTDVDVTVQNTQSDTTPALQEKEKTDGDEEAKAETSESDKSQDETNIEKVESEKEFSVQETAENDDREITTKEKHARAKKEKQSKKRSTSARAAGIRKEYTIDHLSYDDLLNFETDDIDLAISAYKNAKDGEIKNG